MLAALLYGPKDIRLEEVEVPKINDNEVLLKVKSTAICGTDIRMINNGYKDINDKNPRILGHEISGIIAKVGKNVDMYKEGMAVAVAPNMGCGICDQCVSGNTQLCSDYKALGVNINGGFAEYVKIPEKAVAQGNIIELKNNVSFDEAALNEPLSCVYNGSLRCNIQSGDTVLIIGAGPIGLMHAKIAKMTGAAKVFISNRSQERLDICSKVDSSIIPVKSESLKQYIKDATKGKGVDVCITACPSPEAQSQSLELTAINGRINFFGGIPSHKEIVGINSNLVHYKQLNITGTTRASVSHFRKTLEFISSGIIDVKGLISQRFTLDGIEEAIALAARSSGLKNIIYFD